VTALKDVSGQLGPIGAAVQTKLASTTDEALREVLGQQKTLAVELYDKLQVGCWWGQLERLCWRQLPEPCGVHVCIIVSRPHKQGNHQLALGSQQVNLLISCW
jgi:hypothetical protein